MRIISDFHDYYDKVAGTGQDNTLIYYRKVKHVVLDKYPFENLYGKSWFYGFNRSGSINVQQRTIGFCGQVYPVLRVTAIADNYIKPFDKIVFEKMCFTLEDVDEFVKEHFKQKDVDSYYDKKNKKDRWPWNQRRFRLEEFFSDCEKEKNSYLKYFEDSKCPVFTAYNDQRDSYIDYNSSLKESEFFKIIDPFQAFQQISMFLGNIAQPEKPIPVMDDEIKADLRGYNKWSFRKPPKE